MSDKVCVDNYNFFYWTYFTEHQTFIHVGTDLIITPQNQKHKVQTCTKKQAW